MNMKNKYCWLICAFLMVCIKGNAQMQSGADQTAAYLSYLEGKRIGMVINPTSRIGEKSSVDSLISLGIIIVKVFGPEYGFRGDVGAGVQVKEDVDAATGVYIFHLSGLIINSPR